jgi:phosphate transport system permease protein
MAPVALLFVIAGLGLIAWLTARARAGRFDRGGMKRLHSLPGQHGWYVAMWTVLPALLFITVWSSVSPGLVRQAVLQDPAAAQQRYGAMADDMIANAATLAHQPMTYQYDLSAIDEVNPQPLAP